LALADGSEIGVYEWVSDPTAPWLLYFYGNGETVHDQLGHWPDWADALGLNLYLVDYPGYGMSSGVTTLSSCSEGATLALRSLLRSTHEVGNQVYVMGRSAGSIFAIRALSEVSDPRIAGLAIESGIADLPARFEHRAPWSQMGVDVEGLIAEVRRDFDLQAMVRGFDGPMLILHTRHDSIVPSWNAEALAAAASRLSELLLFEQGDHNSIALVNEARYLEALRSWLT
jgi:hypothetical protein